MNAGQLRQLLDGVADDIQVLIPLSHEFDGVFYSPCPIESGKTKVGTDETLTEEDMAEMKLLGQPIPEEDAFLLLPCGFGDGNEDDHRHTLN